MSTGIVIFFIYNFMIIGITFYDTRYQLNILKITVNKSV